MTREQAIDLLSMIEFEHAECCLNTWYKGIDEDMKEALEMAIRALEQETSRDIEEIEEVINCEADAETKCKMISNILNAKPYYFKKQEPCEDAVSRQAVLDALDKSRYSNEFCEEHHIDWSINLGMAHIVVNELKPVIPQPKIRRWINDMRDATPEERKSVYDYVKSIGKPTGVNFWTLEQEPVLDKIRDEIEQVSYEENKVDEKWAQGLKYALKIIDKYRTESEVSDAVSD